MFECWGSRCRGRGFYGVLVFCIGGVMGGRGVTALRGGKVGGCGCGVFWC